MVFKLPNSLRVLLGEGAISAAFLPVLADAKHKRGRSRKSVRTASGAYSVRLAVLLVIVVSALGVLMRALVGASLCQ